MVVVIQLVFHIARFAVHSFGRNGDFVFFFFRAPVSRHLLWNYFPTFNLVNYLSAIYCRVKEYFYGY